MKKLSKTTLGNFLTYALVIVAFIICQSGMMEEFSLGRWAKSGPSGAFGKAMENGGHSKKLGEWIGGVPVLGSLLLAIGYSVVMGWVFAYTKMAITGELTAMGTDMDVIGGTFGAMAPEAGSLPEALQMTFATGGANNFWIIVGIVVSLVIMLAGVSNGIEASCKIMLPILYVLFIVLAVLMIFTPGTAAGYSYIFTFNPAGLLNPQVWVYAFGQCFFSLSVAGSGSVVYGSYLGDDVKIRQSAVICAVLDTSAALLAMLERRVACPPASSAGRLFDGVYALLTGRADAGYDGQAPALLEALARDDLPGRVYPTAYYDDGGVRRLDTRPLVRALCADAAAGVNRAAIARGFMDALARCALEQCRALNPGRLPVVLSGGVFLNQYLLREVTRLLEGDGYAVYSHRRVSPGDEGVPLGQLAVAARRSAL